MTKILKNSKKFKKINKRVNRRVIITIGNMRDNCDSNNLIDKYGNMIYYIALGYLKNKEDAEDIVQEVFIKYIKYIKNKEFNDEEHEKCWLIRVTINLCCNELKHMKNNDKLTVSEKSISKYLNLEEKEYFLLESIDKLGEKYRIIFDLFYLRDLKISEISKILKISEANVKVRLKRARDKLRKLLQLGDDEFNEKFR